MRKTWQCGHAGGAALCVCVCAWGGNVGFLGPLGSSKEGKSLDMTSVLTIGSFLLRLRVKLLCLQLCLRAIYLQLELFYLQLELVYLQ